MSYYFIKNIAPKIFEKVKKREEQKQLKKKQENINQTKESKGKNK